MIRFAFFISCTIVHLVSTDSTVATHGGNESKAVGNGAENGRLVQLIKKNLQKNNDLTPKADSKEIDNEVSPETRQKKFNQLDAIKSQSTDEVVGDLILHSEEKPGDNPNAFKTNKKFKEYTRFPIHKYDDAVIFRNNIKKTVLVPKFNSIQSKNKSKAAPPTKKKSTDDTVRRFEAKGDNGSNAKILQEAFLMKNRLEEDLIDVDDVLVTEESSSTEDMSASLHKTRDANALDLAPARGSYIYKLRLRGRVCDRNVLQVEGPKYNSKGKAYLRAYRPNGIPFARTRPPHQVLPICCNCCKKSVLGCV